VKHPALKELYEIIKKEDWTSFCPEKTRAELLEKWEQKWITSVESEQLVMDKKYLTSEFSDMVKERLAQNLAESLAEECVTFTITDRKVKAQLFGIRRKEKNEKA
jgi:hypothetical protein